MVGITPSGVWLCGRLKNSSPTACSSSTPNRQPDDAPFLEELKRAELENPNLKFVGTMTDMARSGRSWDGETGFLDNEMLSRYLQGAASPIYYIAGLPAMVNALRDMLNHAGVDDDDIRMEEFAGY